MIFIYLSLLKLLLQVLSIESFTTLVPTFVSSVGGCFSHCRNNKLQLSSYADTNTSPTSPFISSPNTTNHNDQIYYHVDNIECIKVPVDLPTLGTVYVLEATAQAQDQLVDLALRDDDDDDSRIVADEAVASQKSGGNNDSSTGMTLSSGDPYGAVLWPASVALAIYLLVQQSTNAESFSFNDKVILEIGAGTGLLSLVACLAGAKRVIALDYETVPLRLLEYAAHYLNDIDIDNSRLQCQQLDICDTSLALPQCDVMMVADLLYEPKTARCLANRVHQVLQQQSTKVFVADSPGRPGRSTFLEALHDLGYTHAQFVDIPGFTVTGERHDLICGKGSSTVSSDDLPKPLNIALLQLQSN